MDRKKMDVRVVKYLLLATLLILVIRYFDVLLGGAGNLWSIAVPLTMGCVIAYVLNIVMRALEKLYFPGSKNKFVNKSKRPVCIVLSLVLIAAVIFLVFRLVIPELVKAIGIIGAGIPVLYEQATDWLAENGEIFPGIAKEIESLQIDWHGLGESVANHLKNGLGGFLNSTVTIVSSVVSGVVNFVIALIFAIYILSSKEKLADQVKRIVRAYVKPEWIRRGKRIVITADQTFSSFIIGQMTEAVILGSLCTLGMLIFGFPYAPMIGAFIGATALIPIVGAYLGAAVGVIMIMTQDPLKAVLFVVFIVVLQQLEGNLIYPKVVGSSIGLPGMWVLAAVTVGGGLMGILGMLLGVPTAATVYKLLAYDVNERNARRAEDRRRPGPGGSKNQHGGGPKPKGGNGPKAGEGDGMKPGAGNGPKPGAGEGAKPGAGNGPKPGAGEVAKPGAGNGPKPGAGEGAKPGAGNGPKPGADRAAKPEQSSGPKNAPAERDRNFRKRRHGASIEKVAERNGINEE